MVFTLISVCFHVCTLVRVPHTNVKVRGQAENVCSALLSSLDGTQAWAEVSLYAMLSR